MTEAPTDADDTSTIGTYALTVPVICFQLFEALVGLTLLYVFLMVAL